VRGFPCCHALFVAIASRAAKRLNEPVTAVIQLGLNPSCARLQPGTRTRLVFNWSTSRGYGLARAGVAYGHAAIGV
jgi:hypothetical protein